MVQLEPKNLIIPLPVTLVTVRLRDNGSVKDNIIPLSWVNNLDSDPDLVSIVLSKDKYSGKVIKKSRHFGMAIPGASLMEKVDLCGSTHGDQVDKFKAAGLSTFEAKAIDVPLILECPINMECVLEQIYPFGGHEMYAAKVVATHVDERFMADSKPDFSKIDPLCFVDGQYWTLGKKMEELFFTSK